MVLGGHVDWYGRSAVALCTSTQYAGFRSCNCENASEIDESGIDSSMEHRIDLYLIASRIETVKVQPELKT